MKRLFFRQLGLFSLLCVFFSGETTAEEAREPEQDPVEKVPTYVVHRARSKITIDGRIDEEDWKKTKSVGEFVFGFLKKKTGKEEQTVFKMLWDDKYLYLSYVCEDRSLLSIHTDRDGRIYEDDSVEIYITPNIKKPDRHFAFYSNIHAALYDEKFDGNAKKIQKNNPGKTAKNDRELSWDSRGVKVAVTIDGTLNNNEDTDRSWSTEMAIPFENFSDASIRLPPEPNDAWKLNPNRHAYMPDGSCQYSQWAQTLAKTGSFWGPKLFGKVIFSGEPAPNKR